MPKLKEAYVPTDHLAFVMRGHQNKRIAERAGIAPSHLSQLRHGTRTISRAKAEAVAAALCHDFDSIFQRKDDPSEDMG
jgi:transcriptional regulator with XRE-family HTH domain